MADLVFGACASSSDKNSGADAGTGGDATTGGDPGTGGTDRGTIQGTLHGQSFTVSDAVSAAVTVTVSGVTAHIAAIALANTADLCGDAMANVSHPNQRGLIIDLFDVNGTTINTPTAPGTYTIAQGGTPPPKAASLEVATDDATCQPLAAQSASATSGTVTLTAVSGNKFTGSFDVVLEGGDHLTGSFKPSECPALATAINNDQESACR
jgi:hypothetical protein